AVSLFCVRTACRGHGAVCRPTVRVGWCRAGRPCTGRHRWSCRLLRPVAGRRPSRPGGPLAVPSGGSVPASRPGGSVPARAVGGRSGPTGPAVAFRPFVSDCERPGPRADRLLPDGVLPTLYRLVRSCRTVVLLACPARHFGKPVARGGL